MLAVVNYREITALERFLNFHSNISRFQLDYWIKKYVLCNEAEEK